MVCHRYIRLYRSQSASMHLFFNPYLTSKQAIMNMQTSIKLLRACKSTTASISSGLSTSSRRGFASLTQAGRASKASASSGYRVLAAPAAARQVQWRSFQSSSRRLAEEVKSTIPFESSEFRVKREQAIWHNCKICGE